MHCNENPLVENCIISASRIQDDIIRMVKLEHVTCYKKLEKDIDDFDQQFLEIERHLPFIMQFNNQQILEITRNTANAIVNRKEKTCNKYSDEITQLCQRFKTLSTMIGVKSMENVQEIHNHEKVFLTKFKAIKFGEEVSYFILRGQAREHVEYLRATLEDYRELMEKDYIHKKEIIDEERGCLIEQRDAKMTSLRQSITDALREKDEKSELFITSSEKIERSSEEHLKIIHTDHEKEVQELQDEQNVISKEIKIAKERLNLLEERIRTYTRSHAKKLIEMKEKFKDSHESGIKHWNTKITNIKPKIVQLESKLDELQSEIGNFSSDYLDKIQMEISNEMETRFRRNSEIKEIKTKEYESIINDLKAHLHDLEKESVENRKIAQETAYNVNQEMRDKVENTRNENINEINSINSEIEKIIKYQSRIDDEWNTMTDSVNQIYKSKIAESKQKLEDQELSQEKEINDYIKNHTPKPDTTDYEALLREELAEIKKKYQKEIDLFVKEKNTEIKARRDEDRTKGNLNAVKNNADELQLLKNEENHVKEKNESQLIEFDQKIKLEKDQLLENKENFKKELDDKLANLDQGFKDKIQSINDEIEKKTKELDDLKAVLQQAQLKLEEARHKADVVQQTVSRGVNVEETAVREPVEDKIEITIGDRIETNVEQIKCDNEKIKNECADIEADIKKRSNEISYFKSKIQKATEQLSIRKQEFIDIFEQKKQELTDNNNYLLDEQRNALKELERLWLEERNSLVEMLDKLTKDTISNRESHLNAKKNHGDELSRELARFEKELMEKNLKKKLLFIQKHEKLIEDYKNQINSADFDKKRDSCWRSQDLNMLITRFLDKSKADNQKVIEKINTLKDKVSKLKKRLLDAECFACKTCIELEEYTILLKKDIVNTVTQIQLMEADEINRNYSVQHYGNVSRILPPLRY